MTQRIYYGWWIVFACFFIALYVSSVVFFGVTAFFEPLVKEFGWSYTQISFATSLRGMEMGIFAPFIGFLVDRFGSRKLIFSGIVITGFGLILFAFTHSLPIFYASFILLAFGAGGCTSVVTMTAVVNWFDKNAGRALGIMSSGFGASGLMIPLIVWLIDAYGWRTALIFLALGAWVIGIPLSLVIRNRPNYDYRNRALEKPKGAVPFNNTGETGFKEAIKDKMFLLLNLVEFMRFMTLSAVILHIMPYLSSVGISRQTAGLVAAAIPLCSIIGRIGLGWLGDLLDKRFVLAAACGLMSFGMVSLCYVTNEWFLYLFLLLFSPGFGGLTVLRGSILRDYYGKKSFGKMIGILMGSASIGGIIGPTLTGWVFDMMESYYYIWLVFSALTFVMMLTTLTIKPRPKTLEKDPAQFHNK